MEHSRKQHENLIWLGVPSTAAACKSIRDAITFPILLLSLDILDGVKRIELDLRALKLAQLEEECRKAKTIAVANYNQALVPLLLIFP